MDELLWNKMTRIVVVFADRSQVSLDTKQVQQLKRIMKANSPPGGPAAVGGQGEESAELHLDGLRRLGLQVSAGGQHFPLKKHI